MDKSLEYVTINNRITFLIVVVTVGYPVKLYCNKKSGQSVLTLPVAIRKAKGWGHGQELEWIIDNMGQLILKPKP